MATSFKPDEARVPPALPLPTPPVTKFKIALCQLSVTTDKERNIVHARKAIEEAAEKGSQLVVLPEIWNSPYSNDSFPVYAEDIDAGGDATPSTAMLSELSRSLHITIVGGSIPERSGDRLYNTCCVFGNDGKLLAKHRKIHLFDIDIPGQMTFKESKTLTAGETPTIVDTGQRIVSCMLQLVHLPEMLVLVMWLGGTPPLLDRKLMWQYGEVLATTEHDEAIVIAEIDYSLIDLRRTYLPFQKQRRGDLYQLVDVQRLNPKSTK
ncbi:omega-amidase, chloroplastic-like isoform X5 [Cornus florida]|uniref:omega-amidase, chloroplastic-like isoform X5 n=1 Tax=Cornus florida TaxID=4283 RepID=UPI0028976E2C|nr:omega-amidase, chloroplastic-like isoform X5 [Cornus florida]